jgi:hypothetical protein
MRLWWYSSPYWFRVVAGLLLALPFVLSFPNALFGGGHDPFSGFSGLGGYLGAVISRRYREREYWRLDRRERQAVVRAQASGEPSGDQELDRIAVDRLARAAEKKQADRVFIPIFLAVFTAVPVIAAIRTSPWWLLCVAPGLLLGVVWLTRHDGHQARLDRLVTAMGEGGPGQPSDSTAGRQD